MGCCICPVPCSPLSVIKVAQVLQISVPLHDPPVSPLVIAVATGDTACNGVLITPPCAFVNRLVINCPIVRECWLLSSGTTNSEASTATSMPPTSTPGSTKRRLRGAGTGSGKVLVRLIDAGITIGTFVLVVGVESGEVWIVPGRFIVISGVSLLPIKGLVTRGSGGDHMLRPRSTMVKNKDGFLTQGQCT